MYKEIEIINTDFDNKYLIRLNDKTMQVGFMVKDIVEFLKEEKSSREMQNHFKRKYELLIDQYVIDDIIENKINPFVIKHVDTSFNKILTLFNPSVLSVPKIILEIFSRLFFYTSGLILFLFNGYFYYESIRYKTNSVFEAGIVYTVLLSVLLLHEMGHFLAAKKYDTNVREIGLGWYIFLPVFYIDLNEVWKLSSKKRIIINLSGIYMQLVCGILLLLLSLFVNQYSNVFMAAFFMNFSIVILNLNPFLKFDGYWVLSDLLEGKDLNSVSNRIMRKWLCFKKSEEESVMIVYTMLRMVFMIFIISTFIRLLFMSIYRICMTGKMDSSGIFVTVLVTVFLYRIFKKRKIKKDELT
ncbi:hypothetical protein NAT51_17695 [Flavobacterium amniphilum]|uniref:site-2 protease family protein n=1 Tax=Flavobacterium amniphilum TaxID=1834035 RepID=UPI00202A1CB8|nr:site-2 protease family protein [Flavobacterium amniphilum]MCL9807365.1 hypothetical protein [Flavobacterium amniphilum]